MCVVCVCVLVWRLEVIPEPDEAAIETAVTEMTGGNPNNPNNPSNPDNPTNPSKSWKNR